MYVKKKVSEWGLEITEKKNGKGAMEKGLWKRSHKKEVCNRSYKKGGRKGEKKKKISLFSTKY
jgi:hypothetical protein